MKHLKNQFKHFFTYYKTIVKVFINKGYFIRRKEMESIILVTLHQIYKKSEPKANLFKLIESSPRDEEGRILVPFDDYFIDEVKAERIIHRNISLFKMSEYEKRVLSFNIYLGASPRFNPKI